MLRALVLQEPLAAPQIPPSPPSAPHQHVEGVQGSSRWVSQGETTSAGHYQQAAFFKAKRNRSS